MDSNTLNAIALYNKIKMQSQHSQPEMNLDGSSPSSTSSSPALLPASSPSSSGTYGSPVQNNHIMERILPQLTGSQNPEIIQRNELIRTGSNALRSVIDGEAAAYLQQHQHQHQLPQHHHYPMSFQGGMPYMEAPDMRYHHDMKGYPEVKEEISEAVDMEHVHETKKRSRSSKKGFTSTKKQALTPSTRADSFSAYHHHSPSMDNNNNSESSVSPTSTPKRTQLRVIQTENGTRIETDTASYLLPNPRSSHFASLGGGLKEKYSGDVVILGNDGEISQASNMNAANDQSMSSYVNNGAFVMGSCHQCKRKREISIQSLCKSRKGMKNCKLKYCDVCLKNHYPSIAPSNGLPSDDWKCPKCRGICHCVSCKRSNEKKQLKEDPSSPGVMGHPMLMMHQQAQQALNQANIQHIANMIQAGGFQMLQMPDPTKQQ